MPTLKNRSRSSTTASSASPASARAKENAGNSMSPADSESGSPSAAAAAASAASATGKRKSRAAAQISDLDRTADTQAGVEAMLELHGGGDDDAEEEKKDDGGEAEEEESARKKPRRVRGGAKSAKKKKGKLHRTASDLLDESDDEDDSDDFPAAPSAPPASTAAAISHQHQRFGTNAQHVLFNALLSSLRNPHGKVDPTLMAEARTATGLSENVILNAAKVARERQLAEQRLQKNVELQEQKRNAALLCQQEEEAQQHQPKCGAATIDPLSSVSLKRSRGQRKDDDEEQESPNVGDVGYEFIKYFEGYGYYRGKVIAVLPNGIRRCHYE